VGISSCTTFTYTKFNLVECPICSEPCYGPIKFANSEGKDKVRTGPCGIFNVPCQIKFGNDSRDANDPLACMSMKAGGSTEMGKVMCPSRTSTTARKVNRTRASGIMLQEFVSASLVYGD
jgi:hypothetical protein